MKANFLEITKPQFFYPENVYVKEGTFFKRKEGISIECKSFQQHIAVDFDFEKTICANGFSYEGNAHKHSLYFSNDGIFWERVSVISEQRNENVVTVQFPLIEARFFQIAFVSTGSSLLLNKLQFYKKYGLKISASSHLDRLFVAENLFDNREEYGWSSAKLEDASEKVYLNIELSQPVYINRLALLSAKDKSPEFPRSFVISTSFDKTHWTDIVKESDFYAKDFAWYHWRFSHCRTKYLRIAILEHGRVKPNNFISTILSLRLFALPENNFLHSGHSHDVSLASELIPGLVSLSANRETRPGKVVQANDSRLRESTTESAGIIRFARDNENKELVAVQGNDSRLLPATEQIPGIVRLARDKESIPHAVVQANDSRLKKASTESPGIIQIAKDSEPAPEMAVSANDSRLARATENNFGIVKLSADADTTAGHVVQANDKRLRKADISWPGIVQLAKHNEAESGRAVQGDDPRLKEGTEEISGRVQFARNKESAQNKAVQSSDTRLKSASAENQGIVYVANHGQSHPSFVVKSDDPRLNDARHPLPHEHDYAKKGHGFSEHTGALSIENNITTKIPTAFFFSDFSGVPVVAKNTKGIAAAILGGLYVSGAEKTGVSIVQKDGEGLLVLSKNEVAARFFSEKDYSLVLDNHYEELKSSGKSLYVGAAADFNSRVNVRFGNIALPMPEISNEVFLQGDMVSIDSAGNACKLKNNANGFIGIVVKKPGIVLGNNAEKLLVAIAGIVDVRVVGPIEAGEQIGFTGEKDSGVGESVKKKGFLISLQSNSQEREKLVKAIFIK